jgi:hypothetical protein
VRLEGLFKQYGKPQGFTDWTLARGDASEFSGTPGEETSVGASQGLKPKKILGDEEEEETLGASSSILGV